MKAAVCYEFGQPLVIEELGIDPPMAGEVKVKMVATSHLSQRCARHAGGLGWSITGWYLVTKVQGS